jgi:mono/diheme cytochrome c family protein
MKTRVAVFLSALAVLAVFAATAFRSSDEAWVGFQKKYNELSAAKGATTSAPVEVKQDRLLGYGEDRIDRCRSCHVAVDDPRFADGRQPLRTHPAVAPHTFNEFGCTVCHEGDGRATTQHLAHGEDRFWPEPLLEGRGIEASCARCHPAPYVAGMEHLRRGRQLFESRGCMGCHKVQGLSRGNLGAELTDVGTKRELAFFHNKLKNPLFNQQVTLMPNLHLPEEDVVDLAIFLKSLKGRSLAEDPLSYRKRLKDFAAARPPEIVASVEAGQKLVEGRGCLGCHKIGKVDGGNAPDLGHVGLLRDARYVEAHLADPRAHTPGSNMPNFWLSATERTAIATYLGSLTGYARPADPKQVFLDLCARCHGEKGDGMGVMAPAVLPRPRVFTNAKFFNWLPEARAHKAIREGVPGTAMPPFGKILDEAATAQLFAYVRATFIAEKRDADADSAARRRSVPETNPVAFGPESLARGKAIFLERCYGCHGRIGDGKGPNALEMLPRPRNLTNHGFFAVLPDSRLFESITYGIVGTGMPPWDMLPESERWDLVNYVRHLSSTGPAAAERGTR